MVVCFNAFMLWLTLSIIVLSILGMIVCTSVCPVVKIKGHEFQTFYWVPLLGAIILLSSTLTDFSSFISGLISKEGMNPIQILILFFSMVFLSGVLDEVGFFDYLAGKAAQKAKGKQVSFFFILIGLTSLLTLFTSNDVIIITFTPFILHFCRKAKIEPWPYLIAEFVSANTISMVFLIGNPTNVYLSAAFNVSFFDYFLVMWLPSLMAFIVSVIIMFLLFRKKLRDPIQTSVEITSIGNRPVFIASLSLLGATIVMLVISSFIKLPLWLICAVAALALLLFMTIYGIKNRTSYKLLANSVKHLPFGLVPLLISMFVFVLTLKDYGVTDKIASLLESDLPILSFGVPAFIGANIINNIPMSVLFSEILKSTVITSETLYSIVIASNIAAYLTPFGALAGIMWMGIIKKNGLKFSFFDFMKYGVVISIPTFAAALFGLWLKLMF